MPNPRYVRNFWLSARIDDRDTPVTGGPVQKDGGFDLTIYQRAEGKAVEAFSVLGRVIDGRTVLMIHDARGNEVGRFEQDR